MAKVGKGRSRAKSRRRIAFEQEVQRTGNAHQSALTAGYSEATAHAKSAAMAQPIRSEYVTALRAHGCTPDFRAGKTMKLLNGTDPNIVLRALQEVNRVEDEYPAPKEQGGNSQNIQIIFPSNFADAMSKESAGD